MPMPLVIDVHCVCAVRAAYISRLDLLSCLLKNSLFSHANPLLIPRTKRGIQAAGEILLLGYPVPTTMIEDGHYLVPGTHFLEVSDANYQWHATNEAMLHFLYPADLS
ncbi:hypothetical protein JJJA_0085 [Achromobacter phage JWDelta]|uniref:Uncharacterized protein n=2 Tax=Jwalphavirus jwalpha TaxID=2169963 RepID=V9VG47_9CAUD|nr:hypothetical protein CH29_gp88 [Achromobacter phage JWAlpha]AHC56601.1 hypothetical protein JJJA_0085 [Achromobacter phage JWDelta]AHC94041.1 hypothetical protein JJJB_0088 [Achromobacter phage JWAlpha]